MDDNKETIIKWSFWTIWLAFVIGCGFFIVYNAQWFIGDDAILIRHTGSGKPFLPSGTVNPSSGRFYPFAYLVYDILLVFSKGTYISAQAHYAIHLVAFVVFVFCMTKLALFVLKEVRSEYRFVIALFFAITCIGRVFPNYVECFSTVWCSYTLLGMFLLSVLLFFKEQKWIHGCIALLLINYMCYCLETGFVLPLSMGVSALLFQRKAMTRNHKIFCWLLVASAALFLVLYAILILPHIHSAYDGSHGTSDSRIMNALRMTYAQKILLLAFVLLVVRVVDIIKNKKGYTFYDTLLLTGAACCCGNFMLRLNWTLYYNGAALLVLPSILYFSIHYLKERWSLMLFIALALFYGRKIPTTIQKNQKHRSAVHREITSLSEMIDQTSDVFWYVPSTDEYSYDLVLRDWKHQSIDTYLGWLRGEPVFSTTDKESFERIDNSIWLSPSENEHLFPNDSCLLKYGELIFSADGIQGYRVVINE